MPPESLSIDLLAGVGARVGMWANGTGQGGLVPGNLEAARGADHRGANAGHHFPDLGGGAEMFEKRLGERAVDLARKPVGGVSPGLGGEDFNAPGRDLECAERLYLILGRSVPDAVGAIENVLFANVLVVDVCFSASSRIPNLGPHQYQ